MGVFLRNPCKIPNRHMIQYIFLLKYNIQEFFNLHLKLIEIFAKIFGGLFTEISVNIPGGVTDNCLNVWILNINWKKLGKKYLCNSWKDLPFGYTHGTQVLHIEKLGSNPIPEIITYDVMVIMTTSFVVKPLKDKLAQG